jgi:hypothetical protein
MRKSGGDERGQITNSAYKETNLPFVPESTLFCHTHSFVYATIMIMKYTFATISIFVSAVFAQQTSFPSQCISPCSGVLSISDSCANSTGYNFDADVVLAQEYLNCICASSNSGIMNSYASFSMSPLTSDVCNVLSKPAMTWVGSWTPSKHVHRERQISIPLQASMAIISLESLRTFQGQHSDPLQPQAQIWEPVLRYNRSSTWFLTYRAQILHLLPRQLLQRKYQRCRHKLQVTPRLSAFRYIIWCYWDLRWCWAPMSSRII